MNAAVVKCWISQGIAFYLQSPVLKVMFPANLVIATNVVKNLTLKTNLFPVLGNS